jgi:hypothetical protein
MHRDTRKIIAARSAARMQRAPYGRLLGCFAAACALAACGGDSPEAMAPTSSVPVAAVATAGSPASVSMPAMTATGAAAGSAAMVPVAGSSSAAPPMATAGSAATAGAPGTMHSGEHGAATPMSPAMQHCLLQTAVDPRDAMLTGEPREIEAGLGGRDLLVPELVEQWMDDHEFAEAHDGWHLVRKWDQGCRRSNAAADGCTASRRLVSQGLSRAPIQQGGPGDGLAFMVMHRHMIRMIKAAFPQHASLFDGFKKVPRTTDDPENPTPWRQLSWTSDNLQGFDTLENIEENLEQFATEDDLGNYIQNTYRWTAETPMSPQNLSGDGLHGALHAQWSVSGSPANLIEQAVDVKNHIFWKLHGWIDDVWERYRVAKGLKEDDPDYQKILLEQCMEMHALMPSNRGMSTPPTTGTTPTPGTTAETGVFAQTIRPMFDTTCGGCHSAIGPSAGLTLGGMNISSAEVRTGLVGVKSTNGEYALIEPGAPMRSWVYLKASGQAAGATCTATCDREKMPPSGAGLSADQLSALERWIQDGATDR